MKDTTIANGVESMRNHQIGRATKRSLLATLALALASLAAAQVSVTSIEFTNPGGITFNRIQGVRLNLSGQAPAGTVAKVFDDSPYISFPRDVPVPIGATYVDFQVYSGGDQFYTGQGSYPVNVVASTFGTAPATNSFAIYPQQIWWFGAPTAVYGGDSFHGYVDSPFNWLTDTFVVHFGDDSPFVSSPSPRVLWWNFPVENPPIDLPYYTYPVSEPVAVKLTSSSDGFHINRTVTLYPRPVLSSIMVSPASVIGGTPATGTAQLSFAGLAGAIPVELASNSLFATVPASVSVPTGASFANFGIATLPVTTTQIITIRGRYKGIIRSGRFTVTP